MSKSNDDEWFELQLGKRSTPLKNDTAKLDDIKNTAVMQIQAEAAELRKLWSDLRNRLTKLTKQANELRYSHYSTKPGPQKPDEFALMRKEYIKETGFYDPETVYAPPEEPKYEKINIDEDEALAIKLAEGIHHRMVQEYNECLELEAKAKDKKHLQLMNDKAYSSRYLSKPFHIEENNPYYNVLFPMVRQMRAVLLQHKKTHISELVEEEAKRVKRLSSTAVSGVLSPTVNSYSSLYQSITVPKPAYKSSTISHALLRVTHHRVPMDTWVRIIRYLPIEQALAMRRVNKRIASFVHSTLKHSPAVNPFIVTLKLDPYCWFHMLVLILMYDQTVSDARLREVAQEVYEEHAEVSVYCKEYKGFTRSKKISQTAYELLYKGLIGEDQVKNLLRQWHMVYVNNYDEDEYSSHRFTLKAADLGSDQFLQDNCLIKMCNTVIGTDFPYVCNCPYSYNVHDFDEMLKQRYYGDETSPSAPSFSKPQHVLYEVEPNLGLGLRRANPHLYNHLYIKLGDFKYEAALCNECHVLMGINAMGEGVLYSGHNPLENLHVIETMYIYIYETLPDHLINNCKKLIDIYGEYTLQSEKDSTAPTKHTKKSLQKKFNQSEMIRYITTERLHLDMIKQRKMNIEIRVISHEAMRDPKKEITLLELFKLVHGTNTNSNKNKLPFERITIYANGKEIPHEIATKQTTNHGRRSKA